MPRSVNHVASRAKRKKILKLTRGYFGARKNVKRFLNLQEVISAHARTSGPLPRTLGRRVWPMLIVTARTRNATSARCGFSVSTLPHAWRTFLTLSWWDWFTRLVSRSTARCSPTWLWTTQKLSRLSSRRLRTLSNHNLDYHNEQQPRVNLPQKKMNFLSHETKFILLFLPCGFYIKGTVLLM